MKRAIILNPTSGRGAGAKQAPLLLEELSRLGIEIAPFSTERQGHAAELARRAVDDGFELVAAAGGDGTLNEVMNGIAGSGAIFAAIPLGTGNDFCRTLGIGTDWRTAAAAIANGRVESVDLGRIEAAQGQVRFMNIAGCGFDVAVAIRINTGLRRIRGTAAYIAGVLGTFLTYRAQEMRITVDGATIETKTMLCAVANATCYGGSMKIAPHARIDDGMLDVVLIEETGKLEFLSTFPKVFSGRHIGHPRVTVLSGKTVQIETETPQSILVDGELFDATPATFSVEPGALRCIVPESFVTTSSGLTENPIPLER